MDRRTCACVAARSPGRDGARRRPASAEPHRVRRAAARDRRIRRAVALRGGRAAACRHDPIRAHVATRVGARADRPAAPAPPGFAGGAQSLPGGGDPAGVRPADLVVGGDAPDPIAAHRAHDALLAQPLRVEPAEGALHEADVRAERPAQAACGRQLRPAPARRREGPGDGDLSRLGLEPQGQAEREFRARGDGALHPRRRALHRSRRPRGGARLHRLVDRPGFGRLPVAAGAARRGYEDRPRQDRQLRRRRGARHPALAPRERRVRRDEAVARVRVPRARCGRGPPHRPEVPSLQLRGQGRAAGTAPLAGVLGPREPRCADQVAGRPGRGHHARARLPGRRPAAARARRRAARTEPVLPAERQGLAGRRGMDQLLDLARAQGFRRAHLPRRG